jgi:GAF domain-containing protein
MLCVSFVQCRGTPHVFTPTRIVLLKSLTLQAAISLENSHLYSDLAEREAKSDTLVDANIILDRHRGPRRQAYRCQRCVPANGGL